MAVPKETKKLPERGFMRLRLEQLRQENQRLKEELRLKGMQIDELMNDAVLIRKLLSRHGIVLGGESVEARRAELRRQARMLGVFDRRTK